MGKINKNKGSPYRKGNFGFANVRTMLLESGLGFQDRKWMGKNSKWIEINRVQKKKEKNNGQNR